MKPARYRVRDLPSDEPAGCWRLSPRRKNGRDPGTGRVRWTCCWLRHGWRTITAGHVYVNDPKHMQVRCVAWAPTGRELLSTADHGVAERDGGSVRAAMAQLDAVLRSVRYRPDGSWSHDQPAVALGRGGAP